MIKYLLIGALSLLSGHLAGEQYQVFQNRVDVGQQLLFSADSRSELVRKVVLIEDTANSLKFEITMKNEGEYGSPLPLIDSKFFSSSYRTPPIRNKVIHAELTLRETVDQVLQTRVLQILVHPRGKPTYVINFPYRKVWKNQ